MYDQDPSVAARRLGEPSYFSTQVSAARRFYLRQAGHDARALAVISGGWEVCRSDYEIRRSGFPCTIVEFVAQGKGALELSGGRHTLGAGATFVYGRRIPHRIRTDPAAPMRKYFVAFSGRAGRDLLRECQIPYGGLVQVTEPGRVQQVFDDLVEHGLSDHPDRGRLCAVALQYLIMKIGDLARPYGPAASRAFATYQRCRQHIEEHHLRLRSLREVAAECHVDMAYLCRLFQRFGRESPVRYLRHLRMNRAMDLLQSSGPLVKEVARELDYSDPYNFSRAFKRVFGTAPEHVVRPRDGSARRTRDLPSSP